MFMNCILLFLIVVFSICIELNYCGFAKRYHLTVQNVQVCPENDKLESPLRNLKFVKINATYGTLSYDISYKRPLDEHVGILTILEKWTETGWVQLPILPFQKDVCRSSLHSPFMRDMWINWGRQMGVPEPDKCPIPAGNYSMKDGLFDMGLLKKIPFWSGQYRSFVIEKLVKGDKWIYCLQVIFDSKEII